MNNIKTPGHIALFAANVIFGFNTPVSRSLMPDELDPLVLTFFRMAGAMVLFWCVSLFTKREHVPAKDVLLLFCASALAIVLNQMPFISGLSMTSPIGASIVITMLPIVSMFLAALILKEPITWKKAIGVAVGASGALLLILSHAGNGQGRSSLWGNLIIFGGVVSYSLYLTLFKGLISRYTPVTLMKWMFLFATLMCTPVCYHSLAATDFASLAPGTWLRAGYVVCFATFITYLLIPIGQKVLRPTTVSMYNYVQPVVTALVAVSMGQDTFGWHNVLSALLVFAGVYLVTTSKSRAQMETEKNGHPRANR